MSVKIRLQRHGKKGKPFYWVVAADARSKRDGKYLEKIGTYNPNTNPATIDLDLNSAVKWLHNGAQPTDTAKAILSYTGALLKHHLDGGIRKGALTQEQADEKFVAWLEAKSGKVDAKKEGLTKAQADAKTKAFKAEQDVNAKRLASAAQAEADTIAAATPVVETEEVVEEVAVEDATAAEEVSVVAEVIVEETPAEEVTLAEEALIVKIAAEEAPVAEEVPVVEAISEEAVAPEENNEEAQA